MLSCEFYKIFKNTYFAEHLLTAVFGYHFFLGHLNAFEINEGGKTDRNAEEGFTVNDVI